MNDSKPSETLAADGVAGFGTYAYLISVDPAKNRYRFYTLVWQPGLWDGGALVRCWGRLRTEGRSLASYHPDRSSAQEMVDQVIKRRLQHGYRAVDWV